jgi:hypothetical protein
MKTLVLAGFVGALLALGSAGADARDRNHVIYRDFLAHNKTNVSHLDIGMDKDRVFETMRDYWSEVRDGRVGNPYRSETLKKGPDTYEVLYYLTKPHPFGSPLHDSQATPVVLKNGKVSGWGWSALNEIKPPAKKSR